LQCLSKNNKEGEDIEPRGDYLSDEFAYITIDLKLCPAYSTDCKTTEEIEEFFTDSHFLLVEVPFVNTLFNMKESRYSYNLDANLYIKIDATK